MEVINLILKIEEDLLLNFQFRGSGGEEHNIPNRIRLLLPHLLLITLILVLVVLLLKENYGDFVFLLKPGCLLAGYDSTEAYVRIEFGYHTCRVASPQSPNVHQWVRMHDLNTLFYFIPKRDKEEMYKDYLILVNTFQVTKSGISKLRKQYNYK